MVFDQWLYRNWRYGAIVLATFLFAFSIDIIFSRTNRPDLNRALIAHCGHNKKCIQKKYKQCFGGFFDTLVSEDTVKCIKQ